MRSITTAINVHRGTGGTKTIDVEELEQWERERADHLATITALTQEIERADIAIVELNRLRNQADSRAFDAEAKVAELEAHVTALAAEKDQLKKYAQHLSSCGFGHGYAPHTCICGLAELIK